MSVRVHRLYELLAEGRVLALLLSPKGDYAHLRLLRALSARLKGEFRPQEFGPHLAEKYRLAQEEVLLDFARKGLELTTRRLGGTPPNPSSSRWARPWAWRERPGSWRRP